MQDAKRKGRLCSGSRRSDLNRHAYRLNPSLRDRTKHIREANGRAKLTSEKVAKIRKMYASGAYTQRVLGDLFGVTQVQISTIVRGKQW